LKDQRVQTSLNLGVLIFTIASLCGCAGAAGAAADAASQTWTCPKEQIVVQPTKDSPPHEPPPEIASNPERNELWQRSRRNPKDHPVFVATGCGHTLRWVCAYELHYLNDGTPFMQWDCSAYGEPIQNVAMTPAQSHRPPVSEAGAEIREGGKETNVLEMLDTLAAQMDAEGNAAAAAQIRLKAQELRQSSTPPAEAGSPSPSFSQEPSSGNPPPVH
jgi:hypothetical protein